MGLGALLVAGGSWVADALKSLSPRVWLALAGILLAVGLVVLHERHAKAEIAAAEKRGAAAEGARIAAQVNRLTDRINGVAQKLREKGREDDRRIAADADDLRVRGPGHAACSAVVSAPRAPGGAAAAGEAGAAVAPVPDGGGAELIALPFAGAVQLVEDHDQCLADRSRWERWFDALTTSD
jgi:hypothetical protein